MLFGNNVVTNPQGKKGFGTTFSMVKIIKPLPKRHPKPITEEAKQRLLQKRQRKEDHQTSFSSLIPARPTFKSLKPNDDVS